MKKCAYCGKKFPDETTECPYDGEPLQPIVAQPPPIPPQVRKGRFAAQQTPELNGVAKVTIVCAILLFVFGFLAALVLPNFIVARRMAMRNQCVSNLKQIGAAVHTWSSGHGGTLPKSFADLTVQLANPAFLHCPGDSENSPATHISYELLLPGAPEDQVTNQVIVRCPIHGTELYGDGSVHIGELQ